MVLGQIDTEFILASANSGITKYLSILLGMKDFIMALQSTSVLTDIKHIAK